MDYRTVLTTCTYCGCGCNIFLEVLDGEPIGTIPCKTSPVNEGKLCIKGWNLHEFIRNDGRLTTPLIRRNGKLEEATWDEALQFVVDAIGDTKNVGAIAGSGLSNEDAWALRQLAEGIGSRAKLGAWPPTHGGADIVAQVGVGKGTNLRCLFVLTYQF